MACRWMKEVYHWLWLFQNCLIEYCHPDIHGLPGLLRKWSVRTVVIACFNRRFKYKKTLCFLCCLVKHTCWKMRAPEVLYSFRYYIDVICVYRRRFCLHKTEKYMLMFVILLEHFWLCRGFFLFLSFFGWEYLGGLLKMLSVFLFWSWTCWKILLTLRNTFFVLWWVSSLMPCSIHV